jgi:uncharacterized protein involved in exopolysaccharide biosynthesis
LSFSLNVVEPENFMATFNMPGQQVTEQYIAGSNMYFGARSGHSAVVDQLQAIKTELVHARQQGLLAAEPAQEAETQIAQAIQQAEQAHPDRQTLLDHINAASELLEGVQSLAGIATGLTALAQAVQGFFK